MFGMRLTSPACVLPPLPEMSMSRSVSDENDGMTSHMCASLWRSADRAMRGLPVPPVTL